MRPVSQPRVFRSDLENRASGRRTAWLWALAASGLTGCAPLRPNLESAGSLFPAWMVCLLGGIALTALCRALFGWLGLAEEIRPAGLVYGCLALAGTLLLWLAGFRPAS